MTVSVISKSRCFGGTQFYVKHRSTSVGMEMRFGLYLPDNSSASTPMLMYLSGFTGDYRTFFNMGTPQQAASTLGVALISPDTSPRKTGEHEKTGKYNVGSSASFYLDAEREPWNRNWKMETYLAMELPSIVERSFQIGAEHMGVTGHCMGGMAALLLAMKHGRRFISASAFSPICAPSASTWGREAFTEYLGDDSARWRSHDPTEVVTSGSLPSDTLIDVGQNDEYLADQLMIDRFEARCSEVGQPLRVRALPGYDHSTHFVQSFISQHVELHASARRAYSKKSEDKI